MRSNLAINRKTSKVVHTYFIVQQIHSLYTKVNAMAPSGVADSYFIMQFEKHIWKNGRLTIPASFVRMWRLDIHHQCVLRIDGVNYHMDLAVHGDKRRQDSIPDHVVIKGDFEFLKYEHKLQHNCWLEFSLDEDVRCHGYMGAYHVLFNVKKLE